MLKIIGIVMKNDFGDMAVRVKRLEDAVFGSGEVSPKKRMPTVFVGPKGGVLLLVSNNFFNDKKTAAEVADKLRKQGYHYSTTVIQTALRRLSDVKGPLVAIAEGGIKHYALRK